MFLTKIELNINDKESRDALTDSQKMHVLVTGLFGTQRKDSQLLYRIRERGNFYDLYISSSRPILMERLTDNTRFVCQRDVSDWLKSLTSGRILHFDIITTPTKDAMKNHRYIGKRVIRNRDERMDWMFRKGEQNGFRILTLQELEHIHSHATHREERGGRFEMTAFHYQGTLQIEDDNVFQNAVCCGIGRERAYGMGMLVLAA